MPGILDFFNVPRRTPGIVPGQSGAGGLLGDWMAPEMQQERQQRQLLGLAQGLLSAGAPSRMPVGTGEVLAQGIKGYTEGGDDYADDLVKQATIRKALDPRAGESPSSVREYEYYTKLPQNDQETFLRLKRAQQALNLGDRYVTLDPRTGGQGEEFARGLPPEDTPQVRGAQARSAATGKAAGEAEGAIEKKIIQAPQIEEYLRQAEELLPGATSGGLSTMGKGVSEFFGRPAQGSAADSQLDVLGAALTSGVPRMEGPQSNYDVKLYEKAAGDLANTSKPREVRLAAIKTIRELNNKYNQAFAGGGQMKITPQQAAAELARRRAAKGGQ